MDTSILLIIAGGGVLVLVVLILVVFVLQRGGSGRRATTSQSEVTSKQGKAFILPPASPTMRPPPMPIHEDTSTLSSQVPTWSSGAGGFTPAGPPVASRQVIDVTPINVVQRLTQEVAKLRSNGYEAVSVAGRPDVEEYCVQIRVARSDGENVSIHLICTRDYPIIAPQLIATMLGFDACGELAEQHLALDSSVLRSWNGNSSLLAVVNNLLGLISYAQVTNQPPTQQSVWAQYTERII
ncbi:MAG: hypothetical protein EOM24_02215 [Chloroflexia bacterium]|nr:hypothetical protein [Chloroflexia bacterium]